MANNSKGTIGILTGATIEEHLQRSGVGELKKPLFVVLQNRSTVPPIRNMKKSTEFRDRLIEMRLPTYPTIGAAARGC